MSIDKTAIDLSILKMNILTEEMYQNALINEEINENELYMTPFINRYTYDENTESVTVTKDLQDAVLSIIWKNVTHADGGMY